jgi:hypothetical protein
LFFQLGAMAKELFCAKSTLQITVQAKVTIGGTEYTASQAVYFGKGPLSVFLAAPEDVERTWAESYEYCNGSVYSGDPSTWNPSTGWVGGAQMPTPAQLQAVFSYNVTHNPTATQGAAFAAGWWSGSAWNYVWTGEVGAAGDSSACLVSPFNGSAIWDDVTYTILAVCVR